MSAIYYGDTPGKSSSRILILGCIYLLLGILALSFATATTLAAVLTLGVILVCVGIAEIVYAINGRKRGQLWPHMAFGCLALICGVLITLNPIENAFGFTLIAGFLLVASGLAKLIGSVVERSAGWGWYATNGVVSIALGILILMAYPVSALWTIGVFVGVDLIFAGVSLMGLGAWAKRNKKELVGEVYSTLHPFPSEGPRPESRSEEHPPVH